MDRTKAAPLPVVHCVVDYNTGTIFPKYILIFQEHILCVQLYAGFTELAVNKIDSSD